MNRKPLCELAVASVLMLPVTACGQPVTPPDATPPAAADARQPEPLPAGTIGKGTLANKKLIHDAGMGVAGGCGMMGIGVPKTVEQYVVQNPVGPRGACCWREKWIVMDDRERFGAIDFRFEEDGRGGAYWTLENASRLPGPVVLREPEAEPHNGPVNPDDVATDPDVGNDIARCVDVAKRFAACAQKVDLEGMVAMTSQATITANGGSKMLKQGYRHSCLPLFPKGNVAWGEPHQFVTEDSGQHVVEVPGAPEGEQSPRFFMWVAKEGGKYVVLSVSGKTHTEVWEERKERASRGGTPARP